jgi:hypothetical protein
MVKACAGATVPVLNNASKTEPAASKLTVTDAGIGGAVDLTSHLKSGSALTWTLVLPPMLPALGGTPAEVSVLRSHLIIWIE